MYAPAMMTNLARPQPTYLSTGALSLYNSIRQYVAVEDQGFTLTDRETLVIAKFSFAMEYCVHHTLAISKRVDEQKNILPPTTFKVLSMPLRHQNH